MQQDIRVIRPGLIMVMLTLLFGISMGITFGIAEERVQSYIATGIAAHPNLHDGKSQHKIWRYAQRAHFHATGISAFSIGLVLLVLVSSLKAGLKTLASILIGMGGLYPLSWFSMFLLSPSMGRSAAHGHIITESLVLLGVGGLLVGIFILCANLFLGLFRSS